jgi:hypothetical protein
MTAPTLTHAQREALENSDGFWVMRFANANTLKGLVKRGLLEIKPSGMKWPLYRITPDGEAIREELKHD